MKINKKIKKKPKTMEFWNFQRPNRLWRLTKGFVTPFRATFIFGASQSELSIKSYGCLKFFSP